MYNNLPVQKIYERIITCLEISKYWHVHNWNQKFTIFAHGGKFLDQTVDCYFGFLIYAMDLFVIDAGRRKKGRVMKSVHSNWPLC
jgi:hypothetical protein